MTDTNLSLPEKDSLKWILSVIDALYEASVDPARWRVALSSLVDAFDGFAGNFNYFENAAPYSVDLSFTVLEGLDPAGLIDYRRYVVRDVRFPALAYQSWHPGPRPDVSRDELISFMHGKPFTDRMVVTEEALRASEIYTELLSPHGIEHSLMCVDFLFDDANFSLGSHGWSVGVFRGPGDRPFDQFDLDRMSLLAPHIKRAIDIYIALGRLRSERDMAFSWLNQLAMGSVILDREHNIVFVSEIAKELAAQAWGFEVLGNRLHIHDHQARQDLDAVLNSDAVAPERTVLVQPPGARYGLQLKVVRLSGDTEERLGYDDGMRAIFITPPKRTSEMQVGVLRAVFRFTDTEAQVAAALATGASVNDIADQREVSADAIRFHLKNMYQKTGTHRQAELVQLILNNPFWQHGTPPPP